MILYPGIARVHPRVCSAWEARRGARVCEGRAACSAGARGAGRGAPLPPACLRTPRWRSSFRRACQPFQDSSPRAPPACPARRSAAATSGTMNARSRAGARGGGPRERTRRRRVATSGGQAAKRASGCGMRMRYSRILDPFWNGSTVDAKLLDASSNVFTVYSGKAALERGKIAYAEPRLVDESKKTKTLETHNHA